MLSTIAGIALTIGTFFATRAGYTSGLPDVALYTLAAGWITAPIINRW